MIDAFPKADALGYHLPPLPGLKTQSEYVRPNAQLIASLILSGDQRKSVFQFIDVSDLCETFAPLR
ncbi:MAG: hypothetical protein ACREJB_14465, partial [Planctomycetaceae bacterium]